jgi:hypothetical protein
MGGNVSALAVERNVAGISQQRVSGRCQRQNAAPNPLPSGPRTHKAPAG